MEEWKKHSSSTGGYYRCTRYEVIQQVEEQSKEMTEEVCHWTRKECLLNVSCFILKCSDGALYFSGNLAVAAGNCEGFAIARVLPDPATAHALSLVHFCDL